MSDDSADPKADPMADAGRDRRGTSRALLPMDHPSRIDGVRRRLHDDGLDALFVTHLTNVRYLCGFTGSAGALAITADAVLFVTDGRYGEQSATQLAAADVVAQRCVDGLAEQRAAVERLFVGARRIGVEAAHVSWTDARNYTAEWFPNAEVVATTQIVEDLRRTKDDGELARITAAAAIADEAFAEIQPLLRRGVTEAAIALELDTAMRRFGASGPSFETIVAAGPNSARPHARPSGRELRDGDLVVCDFGAVVDGYCSDMTRTVAIGALDAEASAMLALVTEAQAAGVDAVVAGAALGSVDAACRDRIIAAGRGEEFLHATGHGVGLDIHEAPRVAATATGSLLLGDVVTVEPGVYVEGVGGVRVEDTLVVTATGCRAVTCSPKLS